MKLVKNDVYYLKTPIQAAHAANCLMKFMLSNEVHTLNLCISFWETRKVRGWLAPFYIGHNFYCSNRANHYRAQLQTLQEKIYADAA